MSERFTIAQISTLKAWEDATSVSPDDFWEIHHIFCARNAQDNARRRTMISLAKQGMLIVREQPPYMPLVKGGNPLKSTESRS